MRALSVTDLLNKKYKTLAFKGDFYQAFGEPENRGVWFAWGNSGNGKTSFLLQLAKELCRFGRVLYNSLEEADAKTMQDAFIREGMATVSRKLILIKESIEDLKERLRKQKAPFAVIIDSFQYTGLSYKDYIKLKEEFPHVLFIFISHADGKMPSGRAAKSVMYDASLKIWIEGYKAFSKGRYIGPNGGEYVIWHQGASEYYGNALIK